MGLDSDAVKELKSRYTQAFSSTVTSVTRPKIKIVEGNGLLFIPNSCRTAEAFIARMDKIINEHYKEGGTTLVLCFDASEFYPIFYG